MLFSPEHLYLKLILLWILFKGLKNNVISKNVEFSVNFFDEMGVTRLMVILLVKTKDNPENIKKIFFVRL